MSVAGERPDDAGGLLVRLAPGPRLDDLRLPGSSRAAFAAIVGAPPRGRPVCVVGPRSIGKSVAAAALAGALGVEAFRIDLARVVSRHVGETERHLDRVFDDARAAGALLLFDEADALVGPRTGVMDADDRYAHQEIAHLLRRVEAFDGLVVLAVNRPRDMAPACAARVAAEVGVPRMRA